MPFSYTCPHCGHESFISEQYIGRSGPCAACGRIITVPPPGGTPPPQIGDDAVVRMLLPVGRSAWAIAAGYAGLFAVLFLPAPVALLLGLLAIRDLRKHPEKHGWGRAIFGLVMGTLFSLLLAFGLVAGLIDASRHGFR